MKALIASQGGGFVKMHDQVLPVVKELGMDPTVVYSHAEVRAAQGWDWLLVEWLMAENPRPAKGGPVVSRVVDAQTRSVSIPGVTGKPVGSLFADCLPLLKDLSASKPDARMLVIYLSKVGMPKESREAYLAVPGVRGVFGYPFVEKTLKALKKAMATP